MSEPTESTLLEMVRTHLFQQGASPQIIETVASNIRVAILDLQSQDLMPPRKMAFVVSEYLTELLDAKKNLVYRYFPLPSDYRKLAANESVTVDYETYEYVDYGTYLIARKTDPSKLLGKFTVQNYTDQYNVQRRHLIVAPEPGPDSVVTLNYHTDGTGLTLEDIGERYYKVILLHVMNQLGLRSSQELQGEVSTMKADVFHGVSQGKGTFATTTPGFFGRTRRLPRSGR